MPSCLFNLCRTPLLVKQLLECLAAYYVCMELLSQFGPFVDPNYLLINRLSIRVHMLIISRAHMNVDCWTKNGEKCRGVLGPVSSVTIKSLSGESITVAFKGNGTLLRLENLAILLISAVT